MTGTNSPLDLDREAFRECIRGDDDDDDRPVVVRTVAPIDEETNPLTAYTALTGQSSESTRERVPYAFLLESAEKTASSDPDGAFRPSAARADRHARYSFVGYDPDAVVTVESDATTVESLSSTISSTLLDALETRSTSVRSPSQSTTETESRETDLSSGDVIGTDNAVGDTLDAIRAALPDVRLENVPHRDRQQLEGGLVGFITYDAVYDLWLEEVGLDRPDSRFPDAMFVMTTKTLTFDEQTGTVSLVFTPIIDADDDPDEIYDELCAEVATVRETLASATVPESGGFQRVSETAGSRAAYEECVRRAKEHVRKGDIYQGVISRRRDLYGHVDSIGFYDSMRAVNPSPYMYLLEYGDLAVVGASPETLISVRGQVVTSNPIAGTCARGSSPVEDRRLAGEMLADEKERAEHTMLVDLARNDVRRVSKPGSVRVEEFMNVLKYSHVQHIESTVTGTLADDTDAFDATRAAFPAGTLSGAPKVRAMEIIHELESEPRGLYGGGVGYFSWTGDADFAIVIRTATIEDNVSVPDPGSGDVSDSLQRITVRAGAGLVADSDPTAEYEETEKKMGSVLAALDRMADVEQSDEMLEQLTELDEMVELDGLDEFEESDGSIIHHVSDSESSGEVSR